MNHIPTPAEQTGVYQDTPAASAKTTAKLTIVAVLALLLAAFAALRGPLTDQDADPPRPPVADELVTSPSEPPLTVEEGGSLRDLVAEEYKDKFDKYMEDPASRTTLLAAFQQGLDRARGLGGQPAQGSVHDVLAYGFDRDHVWVVASYADMARGLIWGAVQWCKRYVPAWACNAVGNWLSSLARGYAPLSNHGVWGAIYWNRYTGGRW